MTEKESTYNMQNKTNIKASPSIVLVAGITTYKMK
jgi:hypothetical protein